MKIYLDTVGCRLNQGEIETMARQFRAAGHDIVSTADRADLAVVNTCTVTTQAASDSRSKLRGLARRGVGQIIATGCWATLEPAQAAQLPAVGLVVPNGRKDSLVQEVLRLPGTTVEPGTMLCDPAPGIGRRTRAFIKVQDGCDNRCTFCVTAIARGRSRSRPPAEIIEEIRSVVAAGGKEVVLTGVQLGSWGRDIGLRLKDLIRSVLADSDLRRLRLSSLEPWELDEDFFKIWEDPRLMPHLHLPLQSGSKATLKRMARKSSPASFRNLVSIARSMIRDLAVTTDLIAGFPGETEDEFRESLEFVQEMDFSAGHVFTFSPRPGTAASRMKGQIRPELARRRNHAFRELLDESGARYRNRFLHRRLRALWESTTELGAQGWKMEGWTGNYLRVSARASVPRRNELDEVELVALNRGVFTGVIRDSG